MVIVPYQDGPYLIRGPVHLRDQHGTAVALARQPVALCRCGKSRIRPFCDGTHQQIGFRAPSHPEQTAAAEEMAAPKLRAGREQAARGDPATPHPACAGGGDANRNGAAPTARAAQALSRALQRARLVLRGPVEAAVYAAVRAAQPLIAGALTLLQAGNARDGDPYRLAPVLVLTRRASDMVAGCAGAPRDDLIGLVSDLTAAIGDLERTA